MRWNGKVVDETNLAKAKEVTLGFTEVLIRKGEYEEITEEKRIARAIEKDPRLANHLSGAD